MKYFFIFLKQMKFTLFQISITIQFCFLKQLLIITCISAIYGSMSICDII